MQLIIIGGQAGVGKTTLAHLIAKQAFELGFIPVVSSFAASLKKAAEERGCSKKDNPGGYRKFCQELGASERAKDPDHWVKLFDASVVEIEVEEKKDLEKNEKYWERCVIVDDCRYTNEVKYGMEKGAASLFLMYGERENPNKTKRWLAHESEELGNTVSSNPKLFGDAFQYFIYNDGTLKDLEEKVEVSSPFWCNVQADPESSMKMKEISRCLSELIDLLLLNAVEEEKDEDPPYCEGAD